uniref:Protein TIC 214 n=1 Tax=Prumnopitys andina TaxID=120634 RepID=A0A3T0ZE56_9CONI|nr:hypothetical protein RF1 [Prumnopitys andina]BBF91169.1 hypothetical protein [Prumnopitys andina]
MLNTFVTFISAWLQASNCALLFGLFYGFLSTLPLSPSQIYFTRAFLLEHDERRRSGFKRKYLGQEKSLRASESQIIFSGSLLGQAIVFFSIYCAPIYGAFFKPHATLLLAVPIVYAILYKYIYDRSPNRINLLLIGIVLQLMNPILFFSDSAFTRLINLLLFRYTENLVFLISLFIGWLSGQILFIKLAKFFCLRIERDSALLGSKYATSKRYIRESFKILFFGYFFLFCFSGNTPNPLFTRKFNEELFGKNVLVEPFSKIQESIKELREKEQGKETRARLSAESGDKGRSKKKKNPVVIPINNDEELDDKIIPINNDEELDDKIISINNDEELDDKIISINNDEELDDKIIPIKNDAELDDKIYELEEEEAAEGDGEKKPYSVEYTISPWIGKTWPNLFYDYRRWNWPLRYIEVEPESFIQGHFIGPLKTEVSDYFFDTCISDGKGRLSFTNPPCTFFAAKMIRQKMAFFLRHSESVSGSEIDCSNEDKIEKWIVAKTSRRDYLGSELEDRVKALSKGSPILDVIEKRVKFSTESGTCLPEIEDPFLSGPFRGITEHSRSAWTPLSENISDEDKVVQELSERLEEQRRTAEKEEQRRTPEEEEQTKLTIDDIKNVLELINNKKILGNTRTTFLKEEKVNFIVETVMEKLEKLIQCSNKLCFFFDDKKLLFLEEHGRNEWVSNTPEEEKISDQREGEDIIQIMDELIGEFSLFIKKKEKKNYNIADRDVLGDLEEGSLSGEDAFGKFIDKFFFFVDKKLSFLEESEKNEQISDQKKEDEDFEKEISAHILFFPENKKVKSIFKFWLPLFDLFRRRKIGSKKLEKLVSSKGKTEKALDLNIYALFNKIFLNELKLSEIKRDVPFWTSKLLTGLYDDYGKESDLGVATPDVRSALVLDPDGEAIPIISSFWETDDDRHLIKGSMRAQRRNLNTWMLMDPYVRSSFFVRYSEIGLLKRKEIRRKSKRKVKFYAKASWSKHSRRVREMYKPYLSKTEDSRLEELTWMDEDFIQLVRSVLLIILLYIRKYILVPLFIIMKNLVRPLLFQFPEWKEDWDDWTKEMYVICDYDGVEYSETQYPDDFWEIGIQVKILSPYRFKPWHEEHPAADAGYLTMNPIVLTERPFSDAVRDSKDKKKEGMFQVLWEEFLGPIRKFWEPRIKEMIARIKGFIRPVIERIKELIRHIKESIRQIIGCIKEFIKQFIKLDIWIKHIKELIGQVIERVRKVIRHIKESIERVIEHIKNLIGRVMKRFKLINKSELQPGNKSIDHVEMSDRVPSKLQIKTKSKVEDKIVIETRPNVKERNDEIKKITEKYLLNLEIHAKLKKENDQYSYDIGSRLKNKPVQNRIREIKARKKGVRFNIDRNSRYFKKLFLRRKLLVIKLKLSVIHLIDSILEFFNLSKRKIAAILNNYSNKNLITEKKQDLKRGPDEISQAYVFHKLWQIRTMNKSYAKDLLKYRTSSPLIQKNVKELLDIQGILESKRPQDLRTNKWKQWLNFCYGYRVAKTKGALFSQAKTKGSLFSQIWSGMAPQKWRNRPSNQCRSKSEFESFIGMLQKWNKRYRYDLLAYNYLSCKKEHIHTPLVQDMVVRNIPNNPNTNEKPRKSLVSNLFTLDKSDLKLHKAKSSKKLKKSNERSDKESDKKLKKSNERSDKESDKKGEKKGKGEREIGIKNLYYIDIFANEKETDQFNEKETDQFNEKETDQFNEKETDQFNEKETDQFNEKETDHFNEMETDQFYNFRSNESKIDIKSDESKIDLNKNKKDESLLIEFLDGYNFLKSYWFFPIFAENLELSEVVQTIRSDLTSLIEYCEMHLSVDQYVSELNSYYLELCKEREKKVKDHDKINEIRDHLNKLNISLNKLSPHIEKFITKAYAKSDLKLPWLKPDVSFKLILKKKKISKKLLEEKTKPLAPEETGATPEKTEATPEKTEATPEKTEATPETKIQLIREEISKLIREEAEQVFERPAIAEVEKEIQADCKADYEVLLKDYLRQADHTVFIPLNKVMEKARLTRELKTYKEKLAEAIDGYRFICTKKDGMSESDFWRSAVWKNLNHMLNEVAELDRFPTIQLNKMKTFRIVFTDLKEAVEKQPKKQGNEEKRDDNDKKAYNEVKFQLNPGWKKGDNGNVWIQDNRVGPKMSTQHMSRNGGVRLLEKELWFFSRYESVINTVEFLLYSESNKAESDESKSDESKSNKAKTAKEEKGHEKKRKVHEERPLSTRAIRQLNKIFYRNDAADVVAFLHKFYSKKYPEILELEHLIKENDILEYVMDCLSFNDCPNYWALLGRYDDRFLVDQMLFNMWLDPFVCLSAVSKDIRAFKLNNRFREALYVDFSDRSVRSILNEKIASSLIFEDILLPRRRREFRILNRLNLENNLDEESTGYSDGKEYVQNDEEFMEKDQYIGIDTTQEMKRFLWPRYRIEDLICMNRYWWNRHNRSRSVLKVRMYPKMDNWNSWDNLLFLITEYMRKLLFFIHSVIKKLLFYPNSCKAEECSTLRHSPALQRDQKKER